MFRLSFSGICLVFLTLFGLTSAFAQPFSERAVMRGLIVDQTDKPVSGVFVVVRRQNDVGSYSFWGGEAQTDSNGQWSIPDAEEGAYLVNLEASGYASQTNLSVELKKNGAPFRVQMSRLIKVKLNLTDSKGMPVVNSPLYVHLQAEEGEILSQQTGRTDDKGSFNVGAFPPGKYRLYTKAADDHYLNSEMQIRPLSIDETWNVNLQQGATLRAKIADANGRAIGGATFSLSPVQDEEPSRRAGRVPMLGDNFGILAASGNMNLLSSRDGDGLVELKNLPPGKYVARFVAPGLEANGNETGAHAVRTVELRSGETTEATWFSTPKRYGTLALDVTSQSGKPITGRNLNVRVLAVSGDGSIFGNNDEGESSFPGAGGTRRVTTDGAGRALLYPLRSGRYRIFVSSNDAIISAISPNGKIDISKTIREVGPIDVTISGGIGLNGGSGATTVVLNVP